MVLVWDSVNSYIYLEGEKAGLAKKFGARPVIEINCLLHITVRY